MIDTLTTGEYNWRELAEVLSKKPFKFDARDNTIRELYRVKERVEKLQTADTFSFIFATDTHVAISPMNLVFLKKAGFEHIENMVNLTQLIDVDFFVHGGDISDGSTGAVDHHKEDLTRYVSIANQMNTKTLHLFGNHDDNSLADAPDYFGTGGLDHTIPAEWFIENVFKKSTIGIELNTSDSIGKYGVVKLDDLKLVIIALDMYDVPQVLGTDGKIKYPLVTGGGAIRQPQLNFISQKLSEVPSGYDVIVFGHTHLGGSYPEHTGLPTNSNLINGILKAYIDKSSFSGTSTESGEFAASVNVNFSNRVGGDIILYSHGHFHLDIIGTIKGTNVPALSMLCSRVLETETYRDRRIGTPNEDSFSVFTVDRKERVINITRFGAGRDIKMNY